MNGPQHYAEAQRIAASALTPRRASEEGFDGWQRDDLAALAQVHATLALAAATYSAGQYADRQNCAITSGPAWLEVLS